MKLGLRGVDAQKSRRSSHSYQTMLVMVFKPQFFNNEVSGPSGLGDVALGNLPHLKKPKAPQKKGQKQNRFLAGFNDPPYVCMYMCVYVCMYACMHACMYVCIPEGPSTQYLRTVVPNTMQGMVFGIRDLKYCVLGPLGMYV